MPYVQVSKAQLESEQIADPQLRVISKAYSLIRSNYVDEINLRSFVQGAIQGMLKAIDQVELPSQVMKDIEYAKAETSKDPFQTISEVFYLIQPFAAGADPKAIEYGAIRGMVECVDPSGSFVEPDVLKGLQLETKGEGGGVGLDISVKADRLTVVAPTEEGPAERAGIQAGDHLLKIDGRLTISMKDWEVVGRLRGPIGTKITVTVKRGEQEPFDLTLVREFINIKNIISRDIEDGIGYIRIKAFPENTMRDFQNALKDLEKKGMTALVLDLRDNPGGLLDQPIRVADVFLESGLIVYTDGKIEAQKMSFLAKKEETSPNYPIVVLVNSETAAGSEIIAGALQDHGRALILGTQTFGRSSLQTIYHLEDGSALRLTTARYFTPKGRSVEGKGITPDIVVEPPKRPKYGKRTFGDPESDIQLLKAVEILKTRQK